MRYDDIVERYDLWILKEPGDLSLDNGNIKLTRDNDLFFGSDDAYNGLHRLVNAWAYSAPTMQILFSTLIRLREERPRLCGEMERAHTEANPLVPGRSNEDRAKAWLMYHTAREELDAGKVGCGVLSGTLLITVQTLLGRFQGDLKLKPASSEWRDAQPAMNGVSIGRTIAAAANAFRHSDEWAEARAQGRFSNQQRISMDALDAAFPSRGGFDEASYWERALDAISCGDFNIMSGAALTFAHDVAVRFRNRSRQLSD